MGTDPTMTCLDCSKSVSLIPGSGDAFHAPARYGCPNRHGPFTLRSGTLHRVHGIKYQENVPSSTGYTHRITCRCGEDIEGGPLGSAAAARSTAHKRFQSHSREQHTQLRQG